MICGLGPDERLAAVVPAVDEDPDRCDEVGDGGEGASPDGLAGDDPEEDFDHVQPRPGGRGEVQADPRVLREPCLHVWVLVGAVVVADDVELLRRVGLRDLFEKAGGTPRCGAAG